jgi:ADP-heptose:LPS heptosyltransferase
METFVVHRPGALGDVLWTTPVVNRIRSENPNDRIIVETNFPRIYWNHPANVEINTPRPSRYNLIDLEMAYETRLAMHGIDAYFEVSFGDQCGDKTINIYKEPLPEFEIDWDRVIALHPNVSWPNRTLPIEWWHELSTELIRLDFIPLILGTHIDHDLSSSGALDTRDKLSLHQQVSAIEAAKLLICGDSMMFTLVGATQTAAIGFCTVTRAQYMLPYRHGVLGWNFAVIPAAVPCYGCRADVDPTTHLLCQFGTNDCVRSFKIEDVLKTGEALGSIIRSPRNS